MKKVVSRLLIAVSVACCALPADSSAKANMLDKTITASESFISAHPDIMHRTRGLKAYKKLDYAEALIHFKRGARFADKPSQGMVAEMLWRGEGVEINRPLAYAWMDLAAERLYPTMLVHREKYWAALNEQERQQAIELGRGIYQEYGDAVAKKRLEIALRRAKNSTTGSRTGMVGSLSITIFTPSGSETIDGAHYYQEKFWKPEKYWQWQDAGWKNPPKGTVDIGPLQIGADSKPDKDKKKAEKNE